MSARGRASRWRGGVLVSLVALGLASVIKSPWAAERSGQEVPTPGRLLYETTCASCHGPTGGGTGQGPPLIGVGAAGVDFVLSTGRMPLADPARQARRQRPAFSRGEIDALVEYVTSFGPGGPEIPAVDPGLGAISRGRAVYTGNCLACHGAVGQGASIGGGSVAPPLDEATALQVAEAVRFGPGTMPAFGEGAVDAQDLNSLVRYVLELRDPDDRGGVDLGHVGPVVEGLLGWLVGLVFLVLVIRWAGSRT